MLSLFPKKEHLICFIGLWTPFESTWYVTCVAELKKMGKELCHGPGIAKNENLVNELVLYGMTQEEARVAVGLTSADSDSNNKQGEVVVKLSEVLYVGVMSVEEAMKKRRSAHSFHALKSITVQQLSQLMWAAQGVTKIDVDGDTYHTAPSGGSLQPLDVYAIIGNIEGIEPGCYHYQPRPHNITLLNRGDHRDLVSKLSCDQGWMARAPIIFIITGEYQRSAMKYGAAGKQYTIIEVGHIGQNIFLQAVALGLDCAIIGAFQETHIIDTLKCNKNHIPYSIMPVGYTTGL